MEMNMDATGMLATLKWLMDDDEKRGLKTYITVIYHANCLDGFGAAWVVKKFLDEQQQMHDYALRSRFIAANYNEKPPEGLEDEIVIIVDFSYSAPVLESICDWATYVILLDHHKTAVEELEGFESEYAYVYLDKKNDHSGCMLAWNHFFPAQALTPPPVLQAIEDRDLWRFALDGPKEICEVLNAYPMDFGTWDEIINKMPLSDIILQGTLLRMKFEKTLNELLKNTKSLEIDGHRVPALNAPPQFASEAGNALAESNSFSAVYWDLPDGMRKFSLRSTDAGLGVSEIAKKFGGGGHRNAAGFTVSLQRAMEFEPDFDRGQDLNLMLLQGENAQLRRERDLLELRVHEIAVAPLTAQETCIKIAQHALQDLEEIKPPPEPIEGKIFDERGKE